MNILFVCTGNISRSFLAEMLLKNEINKNHIADIKVSSAGTGAFPGTPGDKEMINFLVEKKVPAEDHRAKMITGDDVEWADRILVMEKYHREFIKESWPDAEDKIEMLGKYIALDQSEDDIVDPYGRTPYYYRVAQSQILIAITNLFKTIA